MQRLRLSLSAVAPHFFYWHSAALPLTSDGLAFQNSGTQLST